MKLDLKFNEINQELKIDFGQLQDLTDGGYERGYAEGYEDGKSSAPDLLADKLNNTLKTYSNNSRASSLHITVVL